MRSGGLLFIAVSLLLLGGAGRLAYIEHSQGERLRERASQQHTASLTIPAQRGDILDSRGRVLAGSERRPSVYVDASRVGDVRFAAYSVAPVLGLDPVALEQTLRERADRGFTWVKRELGDDEFESFSALRAARHLNAFVVQAEPKRRYPAGRLAGQVLGFVGAEHKGMAGLEQSYDELLRGHDGQRRSTVDVRRRRLQQLAEDYEPPRDGATVVLTIDAHIQQRAEYHLRNAVEGFKAEWGAAVIMEPRSGEVLAMAVFPDFDPAEPIPPGANEKQAQAALEHLRNRAIADCYEPGSIFKPFIAASALDESLTHLGENFVINGPTRVFDGRVIHDTHAYSTLMLEEVISKSSNIGMGILGSRCGNARLHRYVRNFGFGDVTGIGLPGEHTGLVQDFSKWGSFSTRSIPIGQEIAVTPLQIVTAFSVFCNGGLLVRPRIVRGVVDADGKTIEDESQPIVVRRVIDEKTAREFRLKALVQTVVSGTGKKAAIPDFQVFGKTGTAEVARGGHGYASGHYVGSFVGGAPSDEPRAAVVVSLYRPSGGQYYGGTVAAPAAGAILADTLAYMQVPHERISETLPKAIGRKTEADGD